MFASSSVSLLYNSPSSMDLSKLFVILVAFDSSLSAISPLSGEEPDVTLSDSTKRVKIFQDTDQHLFKRIVGLWLNRHLFAK